MKIGIMTFWESQDNYGQVLQGFAMQHYLKQKGHDAFTIRFKRIPPSQNRTFMQKVMNFSLQKFITRRIKRYQLRHQPKTRGFNEFKAEYMTFSDKTYNSLLELKNDPPKADVYITGSDQVWNNNFPVPCEPFLLGFGDKQVKKVAYAASFGVTDLNASTASLFKAHLPHFERIGVREKGGLKLCQNLGFSNAVWTPDPTLLLTKDQWIDALHLPSVEASALKRTFIYTLANSQIADREQFMGHLKQKLSDRKVNHVTANGDVEGDSFPGVREWVQGIRVADFVMTNSFHGMVFCIIFNKNFVILPNTGHAKGMNDRVESLLERLGLQDQLMVNYDESQLTKLINKSIDWNSVNLRINDWVEETHNVLHF